MTFLRYLFFGTAAVLGLTAAALAQSATVSGADNAVDTSLPVEVTADELSVDQETGQAVFTGNVVAGQGEMRLSANEIKVEYETDNGTTTGEIERLLASGDVLLVNGPEAAEAQEAVYSIGSGEVVMTGDVVLTQGNSALSGDKLIVDLSTGKSRIVGRVRSILKAEDNQ
ncbi:MAG: lipopolysaccharide transport periplasmic protein LptA [Litoreibacter sp.]|nr:lipopolysaccharide transport periplasmic protein LptA [Litoreibacter sp.]